MWGDELPKKDEFFSLKIFCLEFMEKAVINKINK